MGLLSFLAPIASGILGRNSERKAIAAQNAYNHPTKVRERAEEAGFNPLLFIGPGVGQQTEVASSNYMGQAISEGALMLADDLAAKKDLGQIEKLSQANRDLSKKVADMTLRPSVPGVYNSGIPSLLSSLGKSAAYGGQDGQGLVAGAAAVVGGSGVQADGAGSADVEPRERNTYERFVNDGTFTDVPLGPDLDEVITGAFIAANNRDKAYRENHTFGLPLHRQGRDVLYQLTPPMAWHPDDMSRHPPRARGDQKNIYDPRPLFQQWGVY